MRPSDERVKQLAERVWVYRHQWERLEPAVGMVLTESGWIAIDGGNSPRHGARVVAAMRALADAPVRWVVNTHRHFDHVFGNQAFGAPVVASTRCRQRFADNLQDDWGPGRALDWLKATIFVHTDQLSEADFPDLQLVPPSVSFDGSLTLHDPELSVELFPLAGVHSDDGIGVWVPEAQVAFVGDAFYYQGTPEGHARRLLPLVERVAALGVRVVVPSHERDHDAETFAALRAYVRELTQGVEAGAAAGQSAEEILKAHPFAEALARTTFLNAKLHRRLIQALLREIQAA